ncbi:MAG: hypothetical protein HQM11_12230 [SAR324 cluster bacterium]|nr:hypothetical protein [SAR324 cluster bacterium]
MTQTDRIAILHEHLLKLKEAVHWLNRSYGICLDLLNKEIYSEEDYDHLEALTSRFSRLSDLLLQKIFRSLDEVEFQDRGTLIDVMNRMHKRALIDSVDQVRLIRELRNQIAHEYERTNLIELFQMTMSLIPNLQKIVQNTEAYIHDKYPVIT